MSKKNKFNEIIDRSNTFDRKWNKAHLKEKLNLQNCDDVLSSWIGDTDFKCPQPVIDAIITRSKQGIYGYCFNAQEIFDSIKHWHQRIFNLAIENEWIKLAYGTIGVLYNIVQGFTNPNNYVLIQTPVYGPFAEAIEINQRKMISNKLIYQDNRYYIDFDDFEAKIIKYQVKLFLLCSPHNPGGIVWSEEELKKILTICKKYHVLIVSDEVHRDLVFADDSKFVSALTLIKLYDQIIVCSSPNKTFNFGGLKLSYAVVPNQNIRNILSTQMEQNRITSPNTFSPYAIIAAYTQCDQWMKDLIQYLAINFSYTKAFIETKMNYLKLVQAQASFFAWVDFSQTKLTMAQVKQLMNDHKVFLCYGDDFVRDGENFMRINFGCSRIMLEAILNRIKTAFESQGF